MTAIRSRYTTGPVQITKHQIDWDNLPAATAERIRGFPPETPRVYVNPEYTLVCPPDVALDVFIAQARRAQLLWNKRLARQFGSTERKRWIKKVDSRTRQLTFTGILYLDGRPIDPKGWPDVPARRSAKKRRGVTWSPAPLGAPVDGLPEMTPMPAVHTESEDTSCRLQ